MGNAMDFKIWQIYSQGPSEQNPVENMRKKGVWAYPGTSQFLKVPPIISGMGKAANFTFCTHIHRIDWNKSPLKILG